MEANIENKIFFFDTTLRDGQQTTGVDFSGEDKIKFSKALNELGVDYIEGKSVAINSADSNLIFPSIVALFPLIEILAPILFNSATCINLFSNISSLI